MRLTILVASGMLAACAGPTNGPAVSHDTARQLNRDPRYAHSSSGDIILGPSEVSQRVIGHPDAAGNIHVLTDRFFLGQLYSLSGAQIDLGKLALARAGDPSTRALAERFVAEHQALRARIRELAAQHGIALKDIRTAEQARGQALLCSMATSDLDRAYPQQALSYQEQALRLSADEVQEGTDPALVGWAADLQATLRSGRQLADRAVNLM
jgi:predicted outer membrane protein